jgi:glucose-fructose oxidoreductase
MPTFSRRSLIELGMAGAAAALPASARAQGQGAGLPQGEQVGFAVVGLGKLALGQIIPAIPKTPNIRLTALVSGHADKAQAVAAKTGVSPSAIYSYETFDRIAHDPNIQVVYIVLPNFMHAEYTIRALKAGKHVLCEKPMATTMADAEAMIAAAKAADRKLMIAYRCHYDVFNLAAMRQVRSGALGRPRLVTTDMGRQTDPSQSSDAWRLDMKESGGGALADMGIYGINAARYLLNEEPVEVRAWQDTSRSDPRFKTVPDMIAWQFRFPSGALSNGSTSFDYADTMAYQVWGEKARLVADPGCFYGGNHLSLVHGGDRRPIPVAEADQFAREMQWMGEAVQNRVPLVSPGEEGLQDMRLMHAILQSVSSGSPVKTDWGYRRAYDPAEVVKI